MNCGISKSWAVSPLPCVAYRVDVAFYLKPQNKYHDIAFKERFVSKRVLEIILYKKKWHLSHYDLDALSFGGECLQVKDCPDITLWPQFCPNIASELDGND